jgi:hypothetical protein
MVFPKSWIWSRVTPYSIPIGVRWWTKFEPMNPAPPVTVIWRRSILQAGIFTWSGEQLEWKETYCYRAVNNTNMTEAADVVSAAVVMLCGDKKSVAFALERPTEHLNGG